MKIRYYFLASLLILFVFASCKTAPEAAAPDSLVSGGAAAAKPDDGAAAAARARAEEKLGGLDAARDAALASGAQDILPDRFGSVDALAAQARDKFNRGDYAGAEADAAEALDRYKVLQTIAEAYGLKQQADERSFITYDPDNYDAGANAGNEAVDAFDSGSLADAQANAEEALSRFGLVLENGWLGYTNERSAAAQGWRQAALDAKANVAARDVYQEADRVYNQAFVSLRSGEYPDAAGLFEQSSALFKQSRDTAVDKRVRAEETLRRAEQSVSESEAKARDAQGVVGEEE